MSVVNNMMRDFGGKDKAMAALDKVLVVFKNNLGAILNQVLSGMWKYSVRIRRKFRSKTR